MSNTNNTILTQDRGIVFIDGTVDAFAEKWWPLESCRQDPLNVRKADYAPGWSQKAWTVKHQGHPETYVGPNLQRLRWSHLISHCLSNPKTARFTSERFIRRGAIRNLSQVCDTIRHGLTPTFDSGFEDCHKARRKNETVTHILTLKSDGFLDGITKLSLRLRLKINQPGDEDANTGVEPGAATSTDTQSPIGYTHVGGGPTSNPSTQVQKPEKTDPSAAENDEWLKKLRPLQDFNGNV